METEILVAFQTIEDTSPGGDGSLESEFCDIVSSFGAALPSANSAKRAVSHGKSAKHLWLLLHAGLPPPVPNSQLHCLGLVRLTVDQAVLYFQ